MNNPPQNGYPMMPLLPTVNPGPNDTRREVREVRDREVEGKKSPNFAVQKYLIFSLPVIEERAESPNGQNMAPTAKPFQLKKEKSTAILLAIIVVFLACHLLRFIVQVYEVVSSPLHGGQKLFQVSIPFVGKSKRPLIFGPLHISRVI